MNRKLKIALRRRSSEQGFAIPVVVGMGLIMLLFGVTMIVRSQGDQVTASAQKATADSLGVAETGVTRVQALLKAYPVLASQNATDWDAASVKSSATCSVANAIVPGAVPDATSEDAKLITKSKSAQWVNVSTDLNAGEFKVVSYLTDTPTTGTGTLNIEGRAKSENAAATAKLGNSTTSLAVQIPFAGSDLSFPGIWIKKDASVSDPIAVPADNPSINASVRLQGCQTSGPPPFPDTGKINGNTNFERDSTGAIKKLHNGQTPSVEAQPVTLPSLPNLPTTSPLYVLPPLIGSGCYFVLPRILITNRNIKTHSGTTCTDASAAAFTTTSDTDVGGVYSYVIQNDSFTSGKSIDLGNSSLIIDPPPGKKVVLYVMGYIDIQSNSPSGATTTTCINPTNTTINGVTSYIGGFSSPGAQLDPSLLEIYGSDGTWTGYTGYLATKVKLSSRAMISAFIYAPAAQVDISVGQIRGAVISKEFKTSNSPDTADCAIAMSQQTVGNTRVKLSSNIAPIQSWKRQEAN